MSAPAPGRLSPRGRVGILLAHVVVLVACGSVVLAPSADAARGRKPGPSPSPSPSPTSTATVSPSPSPSPTSTATVSPSPSPTPSPTSTALATNRLLYDSNMSGSHYEIYAMSTSGTDVVRLTNDPAYDSWWPQLSPDRTRIVFYRTPAGTYDTDYKKTSLWAMNADGSGLRQLLAVGAYGWGMQGHAHWSPDGTHLVMFAAVPALQIFVTDANGANPRQVTSRAYFNIDPNWSPDGSRITFISCPTTTCSGTDYEVYTVPSAGGTETRVTYDTIRDDDPAYSPDGSRIAWLSQTPVDGAWNIRIARTDGSQVGFVTNDTNVNSRPDWSHDGTLIYFHRLVYTDSLPHFDIYVVHPDGTGMQNLTAGQPGSAAYPSI